VKLFSDKYGFKSVILRYSSVYGPGQAEGTVVPIFINKALKGEELLLYGSGKRFMDFVYIKDVVRANMLAYRYRGSGIFNIGSGRPVEMSALASSVNKIFTGSGCRIVALRKKETSPSVFLDIGKASKELGYRPAFDLEKGLLDYRTRMETCRP
jgi:UDP-glucose 4-epimerase